MEKPQKTEEEYKDLIFDIYSNWLNSINSDRTQTYFMQLSGTVFKWYKLFRPKDADEMGLEIANVIKNFINNRDNINLPKDKVGFFKYFHTSLNNELAGSHNRYDDNNRINIPKEKKKKLRGLLDFKASMEGNLGRKVTDYELFQEANKWFKLPLKDYANLFIVMNITSTNVLENNGNKDIDLLNLNAVPVYYENISNDPQEEYIVKHLNNNICEAVEQLLNKKHEKSRACYRELFTLYCLKNCKDYEVFSSILDRETLQSFHNGYFPQQYEIYQKYHPSAAKASAEAIASTNLNGFLNDLRDMLINQ